MALGIRCFLAVDRRFVESRVRDSRRRADAASQRHVRHERRDDRAGQCHDEGKGTVLGPVASALRGRSERPIGTATWSSSPITRAPRVSCCCPSQKVAVVDRQREDQGADQQPDGLHVSRPCDVWCAKDAAARESPVTSIGKKEIDGQTVVGFLAHGYDGRYDALGRSTHGPARSHRTQHADNEDSWRAEQLPLRREVGPVAVQPRTAVGLFDSDDDRRFAVGGRADRDLAGRRRTDETACSRASSA